MEDCKKELKEALKVTLKSSNDWMLWEQKALNKAGGTEVKGGCTPGQEWQRSHWPWPNTKSYLRNSLCLLE